MAAARAAAACAAASCAFWLASAMKSMSDYQIRRIPVVNDRKEIIGVIAQADVATRTEQPMQTAEVVEEISQSNGEI